MTGCKEADAFRFDYIVLEKKIAFDDNYMSDLQYKQFRRDTITKLGAE